MPEHLAVVVVYICIQDAVFYLSLATLPWVKNRSVGTIRNMKAIG